MRFGGVKIVIVACGARGRRGQGSLDFNYEEDMLVPTKIDALGKVRMRTNIQTHTHRG